MSGSEMTEGPRKDAERQNGERMNSAADRIRAEDRFAKLNECFLSFGPDPIANIDCLTGLAGRLLGADAALYNRLDEGMLSSWGRWKTPSDYPPVVHPDGHICYDVIREGADEVRVVRNLPETDYYGTDPGVARYGLQTYVGRAVRLGADYVGSVCCLFTHDFVPDPEEIGLLEIIASAIGTEEKRRQAEMALSESEHRYRRLVELSPDAIVVTVGGKFAFLNPAALAVHGASAPEEMIGRQVLDFIRPEYRETAGERMRSMIEGKAQSVPPMEETFVRLDGSPFEVEVAATRIDYEGKPAILAIIRDVSERKRSEEQRREMERQLEAHKREFYRETILSVTDGKLDICEPSEVNAYIARARLKVDVGRAEDVSKARHEVAGFCRELGLTGERLDAFITGAGEAITNAVKHALKGRVYAGRIQDSVWVGVADRGPGISSLILPKATLLRGFSTKPSLGLGYTIMLGVSDRVLLKTGQRGTTVVLTRAVKRTGVAASAGQLPDIWNGISAT